MEERRQHRPDWYFRKVLLTWRLWALGYYDTWRNRNVRARFFALGPLRFQFVHFCDEKDRDAFDEMIAERSKNQ